jgi:hypothetical protein
VTAVAVPPPLDFRRIDARHFLGEAWEKIGDNLKVLVSTATEADGRVWLHVSMSRPARLPSWSDVKRVKNAFIGKDRKAIQVFPADREYVNDHPFVLHLFCCLDGDPLPDFRRAAPGGRLSL